MNDMIVFVINLPILTEDTYSYYHLIPVPVKNLTIIPNNPYLGMSTNTYVTMEQACPKLEDVHICKTAVQTKDDSCLIQLLSNADHRHCEVHHVTLSKPIVTMLEENYILIVPTDAIQVPTCQNGIQTINQPVVLQLPQGCSITINNQRYTATPTKMELPIFQLPKIEIPQLWNLTVNKANPLHLEEIDFTNLNSLSKLAENAKFNHYQIEPAELLSTNYWLFIIILILTCLAISILAYVKYRRRCPCRYPRPGPLVRRPTIQLHEQPKPTSGDEGPTSAGGVILISR